MIQRTDYLLEKHFNRSLSDKNVEILDPATGTGTGTFVAELIEHIPTQYLDYKFEHEIHANEVAILPYYIANLNIEYTYQQKIGQYKEKKPKDATIAEKFNTYRFADYKEAVIDLLKRVCTVSVKTVEITNQMPEEN